MRRCWGFFLVAMLTVAISSTPANGTPPASRSAPTTLSHGSRHEGTEAARPPRPNASRAALTHLLQRRAQPNDIPGVDPAVQTQTPAADGTVRVAVRGDVRRTTAAVKASGGRVLANVPGVVSAVVATSALRRLAGAPGVTAVRRPARAYADAVSEGVAASGASVWQTAGLTGANVKVAIVDVGFAELAAESANGNLPATSVTYVRTTASDPLNQNHCANDAGTQHGTAVAEIVHQMAPGAHLYLYCIDDTAGFAQSGQQLRVAGVRIVNSSIGFFGESRGDGTGDSLTTAEGTVRTARQAGILWIESAGNQADRHWSGTLADVDTDGFVDLDGPFMRLDAVLVPPGGTASIVLQWDQWPTSSAPIRLGLVGYECVDAGCTSVGVNPIAPADPGTHSPGSSPLVISDITNTTSLPQEWDIAVVDTARPPALHYDLSYWGSNSSSYLSSLDPVHAARAAAGSITDPANSPYAFAVGATDITTSTPEYFSSQGPTIDGRVKPDITAFDGVSSNLPEFGLRPSAGFYGTSASAPHVAGAAALVKGASPGLDATQIQTLLEQRANGGLPSNPPTNTTGHGVLALGSAAVSGIVAPTGSGYTSLPTPVRLFDSRSGKAADGVTTLVNPRVGALAKAEAIPISVPASTGVPSDATAVVVNLTGTGATGATFLSVYPGSVFPGSSNLNLNPPNDQTAAVFATVALRPLQGASPGFTLRNDLSPTQAVLDVVGYFSAASIGRYNTLTPVRILDTRTGNGLPGNKPAKIGSGSIVVVKPDPAIGVPPDATALVVNLTASNIAGLGLFTVSADGSGSTSTLNYFRYDRANLAVVKVDAGGAVRVRGSGAAADAIVDLVGYFGTTGAKFVPLPSPTRIVDTRTGNGGRHLPLGPDGAANATETAQGSGIAGVPDAATALMTGVVGLPLTQASFLALYPGSNRPNVSSVNFTLGRTVSNAALANLTSAGTVTIYNNAGNTNAVVDLFGYFIGPN